MAKITKKLEGKIFITSVRRKFHAIASSLLVLVIDGFFVCKVYAINAHKTLTIKLFMLLCLECSMLKYF